MRLNTRMLISILSVSALVFASGIGYISFRYKTKAKEDAKSIAKTYANEYANLIKSNMDRDFGISRGMAQAMLAIEDSKSEHTKSLHIATMTNVLRDNPFYIAAFLQWDLSDCDPNYTKPHGRRRYFTFRTHPTPDISGRINKEQFGPIKSLTGLVDTADYDPKNPYYLVKANRTEFIINPYFYVYDDIEAMPTDKPSKENSILETTIIIPLITDNKFRALTGVDIPLNHFQEVIEAIKPFDNSYAFIVANNGTIVAHPNIETLGDTITKLIKTKGLEKNILDKIKAGEKFSFTEENTESGNHFYTISPIKMGNTNTPWAVGIRVPIDVIMADANRHFNVSISVGLIGLIILSFIIWQISRNITRPILSTTLILKDLAQGKIYDTKALVVNTKDEIAEMASSANILIEGFKNTTSFAKKIGEGDLDAYYTLLSKDDSLGKSLIEMRNKLKKSKQEIEANSRELEKLSKVAQNTDNAVIIMDIEGNLEWANDAFTKMYGYTLKEANKVLGSNLIYMSEHPNIKQIIKSCISDKKSIQYDSMISSKFGKNVYAQTTISPILDENGEVIRLVTIDSNITAIKQAQEEIEAQRDQLEYQRDQLEILNATKDKFFSILAHDLKNPFSSLHSMSDLLSTNFKQIDNEDKFKLANRINQSANSIYNLLEDLLTWSQLQRGLVEFSPVKFNIANLIDISLNINRLYADKKQLTLRSKLKTEHFAYGDRDMINSVLRNLINNAVKFTEKGGEISVLAETDSENNQIQVSVVDNGIGISTKDQAKLFRIDVKTKAIGKSKEKGTGLGLILCKEFVEKNGGKIWIESDEGKGSKFIFTVPFTE